MRSAGGIYHSSIVLCLHFKAKEKQARRPVFGRRALLYFYRVMHLIILAL